MLSAVRRLLERRARPFSRRTQLIVTGVTAVALGFVTIISWRSADLQFDAINWYAIATAFVIACPATLALKMLEYDAAARLTGSRASLRRAFEVGVVSSAANLLPLPGSVIVTTRSLSEQGATYGSAVIATSIPGVAWLGLAGIIGGAAIVVAGGAVVGASVILGGTVTLAFAGALFRRNAPEAGRPPLAVRILAIEVGWVLVAGLRLWLVLAALGVTATAAQALALTVAGAMSVAIGFLPGGLGGREALIALLSPIIDLKIAEGIVLGVVDRILWLTFLSIAAVVLVGGRVRERDRGEAPAVDWVP